MILPLMVVYALTYFSLSLVLSFNADGQLKKITKILKKLTGDEEKQMRTVE